MDDRNSDEPLARKELELFIERYVNEDQNVIVVVNKSDRKQFPNSFLANFKPIFIAAKEKSNIQELLNKISSTIEMKGVGEENVIVSNARHVEALSKAQSSLETVINSIQTGITGDFIAMDIRQASYHLGSITGQISNEDLLDNIFSKFCIGK